MKRRKKGTTEKIINTPTSDLLHACAIDFAMFHFS